MSEFGSDYFPDSDIDIGSELGSEVNSIEDDSSIELQLENEGSPIDEEFEGSIREEGAESPETIFESLQNDSENNPDGSADMTSEIEADCNPDTIPSDLVVADETQEPITDELLEEIPDSTTDESEDNPEEIEGLVPSTELSEYGKHLEKEPLDQKENRNDRTVYMGVDEAMDTATENEKKVYSDLPLEVGEVDGRESLLRPDDDFLKLDENGRCALDTTQEGKTAVLEDGKINLHHIGQMNDSPLAELTQSEHQENTKILHDPTIPSQVDRSEFGSERKHYWKARTQDIIERNIINDKK